jgi:DNA replication protein DnaC
MEVFFQFVSYSYERRSLLVSSNLVFSQWDRIFKDAMASLAAVDRLTQHSHVLSFTNEGIRNPKAATKALPEK